MSERNPAPPFDQEQQDDQWLDEVLSQTFPASDPVPWHHKETAMSVATSHTFKSPRSSSRSEASDCRTCIASEEQSMNIVVIGGSGQVGAKVVSNLRNRGHEVLAASPRSGVNTFTGEGLAAAIAGSQVVVDVTNPRSFADTEAMEFFQTSCRNLLAAEEAAHVGHHVALSVVGTDRLLASGYFRAKMIQEEMIERSPIPHTLLRATQFFEFLYRIARANTDRLAIRLSPAWIQPIAAAEVAAALADLATAAPRNEMIEMGGPELFRLDEIVRHAIAATEDPREVITDRSARYFGAELNAGTLTPDEGAVIGVTRFGEWLQQSIGGRASSFA